MRLDVRTIIILFDREREQILLLRRSMDKRLFPGKITGVGGRVELTIGEGEDLTGAAIRELTEETKIPIDAIETLKLCLATMRTGSEELVVLLWFTAQLKSAVVDLTCTEGTLEWAHRNTLPLDDFVETAREPIRFLLDMRTDDERVYTGYYDPGTGYLKVD